MMKPCSKCNKMYDPTGGNKSYCGPCKRDHDNEYYRRSKRRRDLIKEANNDRRRKVREEIQEYKRSKGCPHCDEVEPVCLDFHHPNDDEEFNIGSGVDKPHELLWKEIEKCIVICKNHHAKLHAGLL